MAKGERISYFEVSAKDNVQIEDMFAQTVEQYVKLYHSNELLNEAEGEGKEAPTPKKMESHNI